MKRVHYEVREAIDHCVYRADKVTDAREWLRAALDACWNPLHVVKVTVEDVPVRRKRGGK